MLCNSSLLHVLHCSFSSTPPSLREEAEGRCSSDMLAEALKVDSHQVDNVFERCDLQLINMMIILRTSIGLIVARRSGSLSPSSLSSPSDTGEAAALLPIVQVSFPLSWHCQTLLYRIHVYYTVSVDLLNDVPSLRLRERDWGSETRS